MKRKLYFIATTSRCGSTHLCRMLSSTGRLGTPAEYYNDRTQPQRMQHWSVSSELEYFQQILARTSSGNGVCGVKVATSAFDRMREGLGPTFELLRPRYIWLRRRDELRQAISLYRATATDVWHWHAGQPRPAQSPPFDARQIDNQLQAIRRANQQWQNWFAENQFQPLHLWYEDLVQQPNESVAAICRYVIGNATGLCPPRSDLQVMRDELTEQWARRLTGHC